MSGYVRITYWSTGVVLAEGPLGRGITVFEGNYYISRKYLRTDWFKPNFIPGICPYKFFYVWLDLFPENANRDKNLGWLYWLPNPLFPLFVFGSPCRARIRRFSLSDLLVSKEGQFRYLGNRSASRGDYRPACARTASGFLVRLQANGDKAKGKSKKSKKAKT